jgi:hypothetical protein
MQRPMHKRFHMIGCLVVVVLVASAMIFSTAPKSDTINTILAAKRACDAQTGQRCEVP